jgi:hypothetical protein
MKISCPAPTVKGVIWIVTVFGSLDDPASLLLAVLAPLEEAPDVPPEAPDEPLEVPDEVPDVPPPEPLLAPEVVPVPPPPCAPELAGAPLLVAPDEEPAP